MLLSSGLLQKKAVRTGMHQPVRMRSVSWQQTDAEACSEGGSVEMKARQNSAVCSSSRSIA